MFHVITPTGRRIYPDRYISLANARSSCANRTKHSAVMLGDDGRFWVVTMADAQRLEKMGLEWA